jgi:hypothetical protein
MNIELQLPELVSLLNLILATGQRIERDLERMATDLTVLIAQVAANTTLEQSAVTLIQGIAAALTAAQADPAEVATLAAQLNTSAATLSAAITANTPAAPAPVTPAPATPGPVTPSATTAATPTAAAATPAFAASRGAAPAKK